MKVLHITNWYPTHSAPYNALWINKHIQSLPKPIISTVWHLEIKKGNFNFIYRREIKGNYSMVLSLPFEFWFLNEVLYSLAVCWLCFFRLRKEKFDVINFHIAYPLATYLHLYKKRLKVPIIYIEHWSAYHYHFHIKGSTKLHRIKQIFQHGVPVITVSQALANDIKEFSDHANFKFYVIPNIVDTCVFYPQLIDRSKATLFMVSQWRDPKDPFCVIKAIKILKEEVPDISLRIGGYGPQEKDIKKLISGLELGGHIEYLGPLDARQIADEMNRAIAFIHCSGYETFSVVCAEALCCGTPVIASAVGGIRELINHKNGALLQENSPEEFAKAIMQLCSGTQENYYDYNSVASKAKTRFMSEEIGKQYAEVLNQVCSTFDAN